MNNNNDTSQQFTSTMGNSSSEHNEQSVVEMFQLYYTPILVYLGIIGNTLSVFVFFKTKLRLLSSSYYLAALAVSDSAFLVSLFIVWLTMVEVDIFNQPIICQFMIYLTGLCSFLSVWLVLAFTVERFIAVRYPLLRQSVCTVSRAKFTITMLTVLSMGLFSPLLLFGRPQIIPPRETLLCTMDPEWQEAASIFNVMDTVLTFVIPVVVIVILNVCISRTIWKLASVRRRLTQRDDDNDNPSDVLLGRKGALVRPNRIRTGPASQNKVTKMLLVVSTVCLCLNLPSYVMRVLTYLIELRLIEGINIELFLTVQHFCLQLFHTNFGINFALYCISGQNFRKAMRSVLCQRRLQRNGTAGLTVSESRTQSSGSSASKKRRAQISTETQELNTLHVYN